MGSWQILLDILILLAAALVLGTLAEMLRQSAILGYLAAGTLVGPHVLGLVAQGEHVSAIAELGVAVLLFTIGLEFSVARLRRLGRVALVGGLLQVVVTLGVASIVASIWLPPRAAVAIGAIVALSSTACVIRLLLDRGALEGITGRNALGILLFQDAAVIPLMLLVLTLGGARGPAETALFLGRTLLLAGLLAGSFVLLFNVIVPRLLSIQQWARNRELPILLAIIIALGSAWAAHEASVSPAMGAFVAGVLLGGSPFAPQIRADVASLRTVLVTLFFASIGMLGEPMWALRHWHIVIAVVVLVIVGKAAVIWIVLRALRQTPGVAAATGLCLAQVGEFSFVLAEIARAPAEPLIGLETFRLVISTTIATLFCTPFLVGAAPRVADWIESRRRRATSGPAGGEGADAPAGPAPGVIIVGFGPAGQAIANGLYAQHRERLLVIDLSPRNIVAARRLGLATQVGDATHVEVLEHAGVEHARVVAIAIPDPASVRTIIHRIRHVAPNASIVARSRYHVHRWDLQMAGARDVIDEEEQVGLRMAATARRYLGEARDGAA